MLAAHRNRTSLVWCVTLLCAGCAGRDDMARATPAAGPPVDRAAAAAEEEDPLLAESRIVQSLIQLCDRKTFEARAAQTNAKDPKVRAFATEMVEDLRDVRLRLTELWLEAGLIELRETHEERVANGTFDEALELTNRKGTFVDREFLEITIRDHEKTVRLLKQLAARSTRLEIGSFIRSDLLPITEKGLVRAKEVYAVVPLTKEYAAR